MATLSGIIQPGCSNVFPVKGSYSKRFVLHATLKKQQMKGRKPGCLKVASQNEPGNRTFKLHAHHPWFGSLIHIQVKGSSWKLMSGDAG